MPGSPHKQKLNNPSVRSERWLIDRLGLPALLDGVTTPGERRDRIARAIADRDLEAAVVGRNPAGKVETFGELFERLYGPRRAAEGEG